MNNKQLLENYKKALKKCQAQRDLYLQKHAEEYAAPGVSIKEEVDELNLELTKILEHDPLKVISRKKK